jgi:ubiquinone/menaquinone biosynthesis C-methylase UbiE
MTDLGATWDARADREASREEENPRMRVHTDLLWRLIERVLPEKGSTILDAGGGTGRFSIPLARRGYRVVHHDVSPRMLDTARRAASAQGVDSMEFQLGDIRDLSGYADASFPLVLCLDSPLSFCFREHAAALDELLRICGRSVVLCVMSRLGAIVEGGMTFDLQHFGRPRTVLEVFETGDLVVTDELRRLGPLMPSWHAYTAEELEGLLRDRGFAVEMITSLGALTLSVAPELLRALFGNPDAYREFLDFEERFDAQRTVLGAAACGGGGLALTATRRGVRAATGTDVTAPALRSAMPPPSD